MTIVELLVSVSQFLPLCICAPIHNDRIRCFCIKSSLPSRSCPLFTPSRFSQSRIYAALRQALDGITPIRSDHGASRELGIRIRGEHDQLAGVVHDTERGEALTGAELAAPAARDREVAAEGRTAAGLRRRGRRRRVHHVGAGRRVRTARVDAELPVRRRVLGVQRPHQPHDRPLRRVGGHGYGSGECRGGENGGEEGAGELHFRGVCWW
jgi:hypothetical protein